MKLLPLMNIKFAYLLTAILLIGCGETQENSSVNPENWAKREVDISKKDSLEYGKSYLSIYSQVYNMNEHRTYSLTSMISMRNMSEVDTVYLLRAEYYDTKGKSVRKYFDSPVYLAPMETSEIIIDEIDDLGGTGANFIFEWKVPENCPEPLFEGIMSSTMGQQGLSFSTQAKRIE